MFCEKCGANLEPGVAFCEECGAQVVEEHEEGADYLDSAEVSDSVEQTLPTVSAIEDVDSQDASTQPIIVMQQPVEKKSKMPLIAVLAVVAAAAVAAALYFSGVFSGTSDSESPASGQTTQAVDVEAMEQSNAGQEGQTATAGQQASNAAATQPEASSQATSTTVAPGVEPAYFPNVSASSSLPSDEVTDYYGPWNARDGLVNTAWNEGASGTGAEEWIQLEADVPQRVYGVTIIPGYCKSSESYFKNARPCDVIISFDSGPSYRVQLSDQYGTEQTIRFNEPVDTRTMRITIESVYEGSSFEDCCISEIKEF